MKKTTNLKKEVKPTCLMNVNNIEVLEDIPVEEAWGKQRAGSPLSDEDLAVIIEDVITDVLPERIVVCTGKCDFCHNKKTKKSWCKRVWNWFTGKKD